jgi:PKD repeat protein
MTDFRYIRFIALACLPFLLLAGGAAASNMTVSSGTVSGPGMSALLPITLDHAPSGLSGYNISVSVADPSVGTVTAISFPSWATLNNTSSLPSSACWLKAVDLNDMVTSGSTQIPLAGVTLTGIKGGSTAVSVTIRRMNDDSDGVMSPVVIPGTFTVNSTVTPPRASFIASPRSGTAPLVVRFNDTSTGKPIGWNWSFGDGETSTLQNNSHTYSVSGTYDVTLTVSNAGGSNTAKSTGYITVIAHPAPGVIAHLRRILEP